ncbi:MAG: flagellar hook-length control protein FliK [Geobacteraceae bacterium]|nr:flagellar hook-length control protein FliK [Geobacteraceae bacterium]
MDVAQIVTSAVMPDAAAIPALSGSSVAGLAPSPLFREMFAKAALTAELSGNSSGEGQVNQSTLNLQFPSPGRLLMSEKGAALSTPVLATSGREALPEQGDPDMTCLQDEHIGTLLSRTMALRQINVESAQTPEHGGLSLHKGHENKGEVKGAILEETQGEELLPESGSVISHEDSSREKPAEGTKTADPLQENPGQKVADGLELPALAALPAGLVSVMVSAPIVQNIPHVSTVGMPVASTPTVLSGAASTAAQIATEPVRETLLAVQDDGTTWMESQPAVVEGKSGQLWKNDAVASDAKEKGVASRMQPEVEGLNAVPAKPEHIFSKGTMFAQETPEAGGDTKTAGPLAPAAFPDVKETADAVVGGEKMAGKDPLNVARHENVPATRQVPQDGKVEGKGETVLRELPSGVTVLNPAQTVTTGRSTITTADAASLVVQAPDRGRVSLPDGNARNEKGRDISVIGASEKNVLKQEGFSSQDNSNLSQDSDSNGGNHGFSQATISSGSFDAVSKSRMDPLSEVPREHEVVALHENILSQVREKLVNQDLSGNVSKITLKLNPHELGELQINVRMENQKMTVDITAHNPVVKEALLQNIDQLKDSLMRQNISMERFNVTTGDGGGQTFNQSFREGRQTAYQTPDAFSYSMSGYYQEDSPVSQVAFGDSKENSLVDMRF